MEAARLADLYALTRALVDIDSVTPNEKAVGEFVYARLHSLAQRFGGSAERMPVEENRFNVFLRFGEPVVTLSTHLDTVPPFIPSREDDDNIWGRGACDVKGIIAAMIHAVEALVESGERRVALLFVVGEERNSAGAYAASRDPRGSRFLINGEPTENRLAVGSKGALRLEFHASGRMAHSAYPELGESAIDKLIDALVRLRQAPLSADPRLGPSTLNIGTIAGGRAPNVVPDAASAEVFIRLVDDGEATIRWIRENIRGVDVREVLRIPAVHLETVPGFETMVAAYTTDIPAFGGKWGKPFLIGPGTIHVAHTEREHISKRQLAEAVDVYQRLVKQILL